MTSEQYGKKMYKCKKCNFKACKNTLLDKHLKKEHDKNTKENIDICQEKPENVDKLRTKNCFVVLQKMKKIENYVAKHFEVEKHSQRYKCEHCDFMTKNLKELEKHKKEENNKEFDDLYKRPIENVQPEKNGETSALDQWESTTNVHLYWKTNNMS